mmetsp:Transcript_12170/g.14845  ORF Transcript_12170/g.14845 Transcript_12170/m.14845 type:complete len:280 (+) Transcript_12170:114-953(+)|eukprot:CAMPEP_0194382866 /NCGR_PEP_ID=MMETSP0174-20130528/63624_1 /TAXON_ID=216777 /ORGANISM="Proboscia alata, Strain PI-D3" /LENGTH=279 /DNA_ID=CAMNT_0039168579 /DNA_START=39 /DNA_END=878 /DNA_ORIENTATION=+
MREDVTGRGSFNPSHPDADWSGYVPTKSCRKQCFEHESLALKGQLRADECGLIPSTNSETNEWLKPERKMKFDHLNNNGVTNSTFSIIRGPVSSTDPSKSCTHNWESEAQRATKGGKTEVHQLTDYGKSMHIRGRKETIPAFEKNNKFDKDVARLIRMENPYLLNEHNGVRTLSDGKIIRHVDEEHPANDRNDSPYNLVGFRAHKGGVMESLLSGLSKEVAKTVESKRCVASAPYATGGNLPTDPYKCADGERRKDLLIENFSNTTPGYTGKRGFGPNK